MAVFVFSVGLLYGQVLNVDLGFYIPYLAAGLLVWNLILALINEGSSVYIGSSGFSNEIRLPYIFYSLKLAARQLIMFMHNVIVIVIVAIIFDIPIGFHTLAFIPGLIIILFCGICVSVVFGLISVRFRDVPSIVQALVQVAFFLTPIIWHPDLVEGREFIVDYNPFYHFIALVRAPLLGEMPTLVNYSVTVGLSATFAVLAVVLFRRYKNRIPYWV